MEKNKFNPCISKELHDKIMEDPGLCAKIIAEENKKAEKIREITEKFFTEEFLPAAAYSFFDRIKFWEKK
jgi:hypothetical protein